MSNFKYTKTKPAKSFSVQGIANNYPLWAIPKQDPNSNTQAVLSDLTEDLDLLKGNILQKYFYMNLNQNKAPVATVYGWAPQSEAYIIVNNEKKYLKPKTITAEYATLDYELNPIPMNGIEGLNDALPLQTVSGTPSTSLAADATVLDVDTTAKEWIISVNERCYLHIELDVSLTPVNTTIKEPKYKSFAYFEAEVLNEKTQYSRAIVRGLHHITFDQIFNPGLYKIKLLDFDTEMDLSSIYFYTNYKIRRDANPYYFQGPVFTDSQRTLQSFYKVSDDIVKLVSFDLNEDSPVSETEEVLLSWQLLNELDEAYMSTDYIIKDNIMYSRNINEDETQLYLHDLSIQGNRYMYTDNKDWWLTLSNPPLDIDPGTTITLETRELTISPEGDIRLRLKVENLEGEISKYVNPAGETVDEDLSWIPYTDQCQRWDIDIDNIGSWKFTVEYKIKKEVKVACEKLFTMQYINPFRKIDLAYSFNNQVLGYNPNREILFGEPVIGQPYDKLNFIHDGYCWDPKTGNIWINFVATTLSAEYEDVT